MNQRNATKVHQNMKTQTISRHVSFNSSLTNNPMKAETPTINVSPRFSLRLAPTLVVAAVFILSIAAQLAYANPGDLFESDYSNSNIYEFTPGGTQSTFASGLYAPQGLAFDSAGNLFEGDIGSSNIYEFTPGGTRSTFASGVNPYGLAFDSAGNLFEADFGSGAIYEFTPGGTRSTFASGLYHPIGLAFDSAGNLFVADQFSGNIYEFTPGGTRSTFASGLSYPVGLAFNSAGNLFVADFGSGHIYEFTPGGTQSTFASGLLAPYGLAFNSAGNLFEADGGSGNIYEFTPGGIQSTFASGLRPTFLAFAPTPPYSAQVQQPINPDGSSVFNVHRGVVPVKFTLTFNGVATCQLPLATISLIRTAGGAPGPIDENTYLLASDNGSNFRIDGCQYVYNLATSSLGTGTYTVNILIGGSIVGSGSFGLQ
jgi:sugar lactone lactonase YvrE